MVKAAEIIVWKTTFYIDWITQSKHAVAQSAFYLKLNESKIKINICCILCVGFCGWSVPQLPDAFEGLIWSISMYVPKYEYIISECDIKSKVN